nr:class I SAM-dependent methyltransferase [Actinoplanes durhamensis]
MLSEQVRDAYSAMSGPYIELIDDGRRMEAYDLDFIGGYLGGRTGPVLDLGCGPGHLTAYLRSLGLDATGIDMVPEFIAHAEATHPGVPFRLGSMDALDVADGSVAGVLAWYSLIHRPPADLDVVLAELRRVVAPGGMVVAGFFDGERAEPFDHRVITAYRWPVDEFAGRMARAGFTEVQRLQRTTDRPDRLHAALAAAG